MNSQCISCGTELPDDFSGLTCPLCSPGSEAPVTSEQITVTAHADIPMQLVEDNKSGENIGRYKLLQKLGEGGMGSVWMAEQEKPFRRVALKLVKLGMDTRQVVARFRAEQQALALMDHPNIAKVFDVGATENGRPFFVMELVRGIPVTEYCDQEKLALKERLELFMQICHAIQHAHQKGVIHRDVKPSNILVSLQDGVPIPKIIDFGIAKATQGKLVDETLFTALEQFIGTPAYMSPEQAEMNALDIDTRSDIYSLGVLLYELLSGKTPFDNRGLLGAGLDEIRRVIREVEPLRPSTRLSTLAVEEQTALARKRASEPPKLLGIIRGDLDWIVMRCLEKDRRRRYDTANGLSSDIQRYLASEPVIARPPSSVYRIQKLVRRNKLGFAAAASVALALVAGLIISVSFYAREAAASKRARTAEGEQTRLGHRASESSRRAQQLVDDLLMLAESTPGNLAQQLADKAVSNYVAFVHESPGDPALKANLGKLYRRQAFIVMGAENVKNGHAAYVLGQSLTTSTESDSPIPKAHSVQLEKALLALTNSRAIFQDLTRDFPTERAYQSELAESWTAQADLFGGSNAPSLLKEALEIRRALHQADPTEWKAQYALAGLLSRAAGYPTYFDEAQLCNEELKLRQDLANEQTSNSAIPETVWSEYLGACGRAVTMSTNSMASLPYLRKIVSVSEALLAQSKTAHTTNATIKDFESEQLRLSGMAKISSTLAESGNQEEGRKLAEQALNSSREVYSTYPQASKESLLDVDLTLASAFTTLNQPGKAQDLYRKSAETLERFCVGNSSAAHRYKLEGVQDLMASAALKQGHSEEALQIAEAAVKFWKVQSARWFPPTYYDGHLISAWFRKSNLYEVLGKGLEAGRCLEAITEIENLMLSLHPEELIHSAQAIASHSLPPEREHLVEWQFARKYLQQATGVLEMAFRRSTLPCPEALLQEPPFKRMMSDTNFVMMAEQWRTRSLPNRNPDLVVFATNTIAIKSALNNQAEICIKGRISRSSFNKTKTGYEIGLDNVSAKDFTLFIHHALIPDVELAFKKFGNSVAEIFRAGAELEVRGKPVLYEPSRSTQIVEIKLENPGQILVLTPPAIEPSLKRTASSVSLPAAASQVDSGSSEATNYLLTTQFLNDLKNHIGESISVTGSVKSAKLSKTKKAFNIEFSKEKSEFGLLGFARAPNIEELNNKFGGDATTLAGKNVRLEGTLVKYPFTNTYPGWLEIEITNSHQIESYKALDAGTGGSSR